MSAAVMMTTMPGNWTNTTGYNCVGVNSLPLHGAEILILALAYLVVVAMYVVTFMDLAIKQTWPAKFLDAEVQKRIAKLQEDFPGLKPKTITAAAKKNQAEEEGDAKEWDSILKVDDSVGGEIDGIQYDAIVSQEPYIASCCIDEDLTYILANNQAFGTVSVYCSSTVRGYAILSTLLIVCGFFMGFLWVHNAMIDPVGTNYARYCGIVGYFLVFLTGMVMCAPSNLSVYRNRNIALWGSLATDSIILKLHEVGIIGFCIVPFLGNVWQLVFDKRDLVPNRTAMWIGIGCQLGGLIVFGCPKLFQKFGVITKRQSNQIEIIGEIMAVMASIMTFIQIETYSTAACGSLIGWFDKAIWIALFAPIFALCVKKYTGAPVAPYANDPSVMLMNNGTPVATSGPVPVLNYDRQFAVLPIVQPKE